MTVRYSMRTTVAVLALFTVAACAKKDEVTTDSSAAAMAPPPPPPPPSTPTLTPTPIPTVSTIETGKHVGADHRVVAVDSMFTSSDTIYVAIVTEHATPTSSLIAKWTSENGKMVDSTMQGIVPDPANPVNVTEFHLAKKGWPAGKYKVEVWLDGVSAGSKDITIKK